MFTNQTPAFLKFRRPSDGLAADTRSASIAASRTDGYSVFGWQNAANWDWLQVTLRLAEQTRSVVVRPRVTWVLFAG